MPAPAISPGPDESISAKLVAPTTALYVCVLLVYTARIYTRFRPVRNLGWDDLAITAALMCGLLSWSFQMSSVAYGLGRPNLYITAENLELANRFLFIGQPPWAWSVELKIFLYSMIGLQIAIAIGVNCSQYLMCRPLATLWDPTTPNVRCWSPMATEASVYTSAVLGILTDATFATFPIAFIRHLNRRFWERAIICSLMGLGIFASIASIVKTTLIPYYGKSGNNLCDAGDITLWSTLEQQIGLIAAYVPPLKRPFETLLRHYGLLSATGSSSGSSGYVFQKDGQNFELVRVPTKPKLRTAMISEISTINEEDIPDVQDLEKGIDKRGDVQQN